MMKVMKSDYKQTITQQMMNQSKLFIISKLYTKQQSLNFPSSIMPSPSLQKLLFVKNYIALQQQLKTIPRSNAQTLDNLFIQTVEMKLQLFKAVKKSQTNRQSLEHFQQNIQRLQENYESLKNYEIKNLLILGLSFFVFELTPKKQGSSNNFMLSEMKQSKNSHPTNSSRQRISLQQKSLLRQLLSLPTVTQYIADPTLLQQIKSSMYLFLTFIQLHTKKLIKTKRKQNKQQIYYLLKLINELSQKFPETMLFVKKIQEILVHLRIYYLNSSVEITYSVAIQEMLELIVEQYDARKSLGMSSETVIALLYNVLKILLGVDQIPPKIMDFLSIIFKFHNMPTPNSYNEIIFRLFLIIKIIIFKQCESLTNTAVSTTNIDVRNSQDEDDNPLEIQGEDPILGETFSTFLNINLDTTVVELKEVSRNIVRHRVASLATIIGFKLGIQNFSIDFLHLMHDSPFNNDIQTIKLCFQLFQAREFSKLQHLFKIVLSASTCKNLKQREVLIAMCSIFIGVYLQNRQEGLLYAKLNHFESKKNVLREETLLQHLGFSYYNLAKSEVYLQNRQVYLVKALQNFKKSYELNPNNYVVTYCMGKVYLQLYDSENAYKYALQSCKCNRGRWVPFTLLACVYMVQRKIHKAMIIIDQLLKKYQDQTILYYIRAYIEANKILLQVEHDQQVQAAKGMDEQIYELTKDRVLKSKSLLNLNTYCQQFYNKSRSEVKEIDENFFNVTNNFLQDAHEQTFTDSPSTLDRKALLMIVNLFIQVEQLQTAEGLLRTIPESQQTSQSRYYHALIHSKRKEFEIALSDYKKILEKDNMHVSSLVQCSLLQKNDPEALNYITLAGKFTNDNEFLFAKGMVLCRLQRFQEAHQYFIKDAEVAWLEELPEKLYYY